MNGFSQIEKDDFIAIKDTQTKLNILFHYTYDMTKNLQKQVDICNTRFCAIEKITKKAVSMGALAGTITVGTIVAGSQIIKLFM